MGLKKWVQHISGHGEKWEVLSEHPYGWKVPVPPGRGMGGETWFPKSEYRLCDPPETWEECTREVADVRNGEFCWKPGMTGARYCLKHDERWAWKGDALVIERRKS